MEVGKSANGVAVEGASTLSVAIGRQSVLDKLFVVGGYQPDANKRAEIVDLADTPRACRNVTFFPGAKFGSFGVYFGDEAVVCGGVLPFGYDCFIYDVENNRYLQSCTEA